MNISINDRICEAKPGDRLLDAARASHSHIGYFCGGNAICQTCYVKVLEGMELLSPVSDAEKSMLSDKLISEGNRMACQTIIEKPGTITVLTTVEEAKRMTLSDPLSIPAYMGKMGWESAVKFTDTIAFQARREQGEYALDAGTLLRDVIGGIVDAITLVIEAVQSALGITAQPNEVQPAVPVNGSCCETVHTEEAKPCNCGNGRLISPEILRHRQEKEVLCN